MGRPKSPDGAQSVIEQLYPEANAVTFIINFKNPFEKIFKIETALHLEILTV